MCVDKDIMLMRNDCCVCAREQGVIAMCLVAEESATGRHRVEKSTLFQYF